MGGACGPSFDCLLFIIIGLSISLCPWTGQSSWQDTILQSSLKEGFCVFRCPYHEEARFCMSILGSCVASAVRLPRMKLGFQLCDLEKVIGPFCASVFSFVHRGANDLPLWIVLKITCNMLCKQMANVTYNY